MKSKKLYILLFITLFGLSLTYALNTHSISADAKIQITKNKISLDKKPHYITSAPWLKGKIVSGRRQSHTKLNKPVSKAPTVIAKKTNPKSKTPEKAKSATTITEHVNQGQQPETPKGTADNFNDNKTDINNNNTLVTGAGGGYRNNKEEDPSATPHPTSSTATTYTNTTDSTTLTAAEWKEKLLSKPTLDNMKLLLNAYNSQEISEDTFYSVTQAMLEDTRTNVRTLAIKGLATVPNLSSFLQLASYKSVETDSQLKQLIQNNLESYIFESRYDILTSALESSDRVSVLEAADLIQKWLTKIQNASTDSLIGLGVRTGQTRSIAQVDFSPIVPALENLTSSSDQEISRTAQGLIDQIEGQKNN